MAERLDLATRQPVRKKPVTRLAAKVLLTIGAGLVSILLLEAGLRLLHYNPFAALLSGEKVLVRESSHENLDFELTPNASGDAWGCDVAINSHGMRDKEYTVKKPSGVFRIAIAGDSIAFGTKLSQQDLFPEKLEALLRKEGWSAQVLNFGVPGYDTLNEVALLESKALQFNPDLAIIAFCINDVGIVAPARDYIRKLAKYRSPLYRFRTLQLITTQLDRWKLKRQFDYDVSEERYRRENMGKIRPIGDDGALQGMMRRLGDISKDIPKDSVQHLFLKWYTSEDRVGRLRYAFERFGRFAEDHDVPVAILVVPLLDDSQYADGYALVYRIIRHEAARVGIDTIEVYDTFKAAGLPRIRGITNDRIHPSPFGHKLIATAIKEYLLVRHASSFSRKK